MTNNKNCFLGVGEIQLDSIDIKDVRVFHQSSMILSFYSQRVEYCWIGTPTVHVNLKQMIEHTGIDTTSSMKK